MTDHAISAVPQTGSIPRLARWVLANRRIVVLVWLLLLPAGIYGASHVSKRLSLDFSLPGQPGYEAANKLKHISAEEAAHKLLIVEGVMAIQAGVSPRIVEEMLKSHVPPGERTESDAADRAAA